ncbi:XRE family transcriptional regulator [Staphylococcus aureus]|uniref:XRE family transcriptional regulator n=2 Tax=Staphylococcus aureus TaxID=1280 RepID=UPI00024C2CDC|nr:XRE family transcriptional regulator [Staphylococcus aureus]EGQ0411586.1 helix-turn-helix transcriptional regulator [Staphylococcus aureus]EGQ0417332.1 helix-turn-helix transcriptional regulator [Staphylococcus aureus]EGQ0425829.1 helix-turn-helix transcriptional regulator [Staphylococcus aureus]EGQ0434363.1 helix-turn-helix transcriptional regulator [Staphylococcus aureus]EGQ0437160.1 helix-turn-helix transcriptional regulator [Staphylococcus aureus]
MNKERNIIIAKNIRKFLNDSNMSQKKLAELINIKPSTLSDYLNLRSNPSHGVIQRIADVFEVGKSDIDTTYKDDNDITSIYNKLTPPRQENVLNYANEQLDEQNKVTSIDGYKESKLVSYIACGATGAGIGEELYDDILHEEVFFKEDETPSNADFCILVNGDSMEPMLKQGTYAFIKKEDSIKDGTIALVVLDGVSLIKRVDICEDYINLVSLNPKYDDIKVASFSDIKVMGKVVL